MNMEIGDNFELGLLSVCLVFAIYFKNILASIAFLIGIVSTIRRIQTESRLTPDR